MLSYKELAQYALLVKRQIDELELWEKIEVMQLASKFIDIELGRSVRAQQQPPQVRDE